MTDYFFERAVFLDVDSMGEGLVFDTLIPYARHWAMHEVTAADETLERVRYADLVISNKVVLDRATLEACDNLKLVCVAATGINNIDLQAARERGIAVSNVTAYGTPSVVQHVFTLLLALTNRLTEHQASVKSGAWGKAPYFCVLDYPFRELAGKVFGIIGFGELGQGVARVAEALGMQVIISDRPGSRESTPGRLPLNEVLRRADVVSLHVPLADNTRNLIGEAELKTMKNDAILINAARGGIVDEQALAEALLTNQIGGAGFDVLSVEPPRRGNVLLDLDLPNLLITPHVAWAATESRQRLIDLMADNINAYTTGERLNRVD
jgi:glycerate dehydrogenase